MEIFSDSSKSGGGPIKKCKYLAEKWKAYIAFEDDSIAERLITSKEVKYRNYRFCITKANFDLRKSSLSNQKKNLTISEKKTSSSTDTQKSDLIILKNVPRNKNKIDVLKYAAIIARLAPKSANLIEMDKGIWKIEFERKLGNQFLY